MESHRSKWPLKKKHQAGCDIMCSVRSTSSDSGSNNECTKNRRKKKSQCPLVHSVTLAEANIYTPANMQIKHNYTPFVLAVKQITRFLISNISISNAIPFSDVPELLHIRPSGVARTPVFYCTD